MPWPCRPSVLCAALLLLASSRLRIINLEGSDAIFVRGVAWSSAVRIDTRERVELKLTGQTKAPRRARPWHCAARRWQ